MPSPAPDSVFLNQLAWRLAAGIAAAAALVAVILTTSRQSAQGSAVSAPASKAEVPPESSPLPAALPMGGSLARCIEFCAGHVTIERSFVVFENGSCVIVNEPCAQPIVDALHTLEECAGPNARFLTREIENGHYLVTYRQPVFHCLFAEEISSHRAQVERDFLRYLTPAEIKSMAPGFDPPFHAKLGLIARARLNQDAADPIVSKVIRAKSTAEPDPTPAYDPVGPPVPGTPDSLPAPTHQPRIVPPYLLGA